MNTSKNQCRGCTLVELMVVIAIITIVMAILVPLLKATKEEVHSALCVTQPWQPFQEASKV